MISFDPNLSIKKRAQIGCVAGLVGGFAIFVSIFVIDLSLGADQGTFYKVVGLAVGASGIEATLLGMISHMLVAALIGTVFGLGSSLHKKLGIYSLKKGAIAGITTGLVVFFVFFVPISVYLIMPIIQSSVLAPEAKSLIANSNVVLIGSFEMHAVYGIVMGVFFAIAVNYESKNRFELQTAEA